MGQAKAVISDGRKSKHPLLRHWMSKLLLRDPACDNQRTSIDSEAARRRLHSATLRLSLARAPEVSARRTCRSRIEAAWLRSCAPAVI